MEIPKNIIAGILLSLCTLQLYAQDVPRLDESELLQKSDLKKKPGWIKIYLDSNFQATEENGLARYEYFEFVNRKGHYNSTFSSNLPFPKKAVKITYTHSAIENPKLLNGTASFYDKRNKLVLQCQFKEGFYIKACDWKKPGTNARTLVEYIPKNKSVELFANYFNKEGILRADSHEENDGYSYKTLPGNKTITPISN